MLTFFALYCIYYGTAQMQLHSQVRMSSKALEGLMKVTCYKLCECSRFSTLCRVLLAQLTSVIVYQLVTTFIVPFSSQCTYSKKVTPLRGCLLGFAHLLF